MGMGSVPRVAISVAGIANRTSVLIGRNGSSSTVLQKSPEWPLQIANKRGISTWAWTIPNG